MAVTASKLITGRRKEAVARVRLVPGSGEFVVNDRKESVVANERFHTVIYRDGVQVGESTEVSLDKFSIRPDGT